MAEASLSGSPCQVNECTFVAESPTALLSHYRIIHRGDLEFNVPCLYSLCSHKPFETEDALRKHLKKHHGQRSEVIPSSPPQLDPAIEVSHPHNEPCIPMELERSITQPVVERQPSGSENFDKRDSAVYLLKILEGNKLNQSTLQNIMHHTNELVNQAVSLKLIEVATSLRAQGCEHVGIVEDLQMPYRSESTNRHDLFAGLHTQYSQTKFFTDHLGMINPRRILLPDNPKYYGRVRTGKPQESKQQSYFYVPVLDQLLVLLKKKDIYAEIFKDKIRIPGVLMGFEDGQAFAKSEFFRLHPKAVQINLYIDEVQLCDPLGSKTIENKVVFVYFTLGNLPLQFKSSLKNIYLLSIFLNHHVSSYGLNQLLRPIVNDLKLLETGVDFKINEKEEKIFGTVTIFAADNLASHAIGGFKTSFSRVFRKCRYCLGTDSDIQTKFSDSEFISRNQADHDLQCEALDTSLSSHFAKLYGINYQSVLNEMQYFHVIGGLAPDVMHDILEGCLPLTICEVLFYFIKVKKYFTLEMLNHAVRNFRYGHSEVKDKPSVIDMKHIEKRKLRQSAAQIWTLAVFLPIMIGYQVPADDERWLCLTSLLEICRIIFQNTITEFDILKLEFLFDEYLTSFRKCFPLRRITPKMHFLVHYPRQIRLLGPLGSYWCMRYEAKHSYFKSLSRSIGNYINLPMTLSFRHQQWQCKNLVDAGDKYLEFDITLPKQSKNHEAVMVPLGTLKYFGHLADAFSVNDPETMVNRLKWIKINSNTYKVKSDMILCKLEGSDMLGFGLIVDILMYNRNVFFLCQLYRSLTFDCHYQAYILRKRTDNFHLAVSYRSLIDHRVYHLHSPVDFTQNNVNLQSLYVITKTEISNIVSNAC